MTEWGTGWNVPPQMLNPTAPPKNPWDLLNQDQLLMEHDALQKQIAKLKETEMELRKYIVDRAFPNKHEGMNTLELGNGYELKANIKFNYKLADNKVVEDCLDRIALTGNQGAFIAERLVSWKPSFLVTEYRVLQEEAKEGSDAAKAILKIVNDEMLVILEAAPELKIKEPRKAKK